MPIVSTERFVELVRKSQLAEPEKIDAAIEVIRLKHGGKLPEDVVQMAQALQEQKVITRWHAEKFLQGKYKGFFLGKYKLLGHIGTGGMSSVYLAEHTKMHDLRAIKVLPTSKRNKSSYLARFQQEARAIASLNHPNIVRAYDIDNEGDTHYIVMEYVEGGDLQSLVKKKGPLPFDKVADYAAQAARGLQHAHDSGLIHRDVKPATLLIRKDGTVKLLDLGLALFTDEDKASLTIDHNDKVLGTADYLAPEQALNSHGVDQRADLYGLGCTMYFMLTGNPPFPEGSIAQRIAKHQKMMPTQIRKLRHECPGELEGICWKLMQKDPKFRYASATQTAEVLETWLANYRVTVTPGGRSPGPRGDEGSHVPSGSPFSSPSGHGSADTLSNRGSDTMGGKSGSDLSSGSSIISHLSSSDSGILIRMANSATSSSRIDLQAESRSSGRQPGLGNSPNASGKGSTMESRPKFNPPAVGRLGRGSAAQGRAKQNPSIPSQPQTEGNAISGRQTLWIVGGILMFVLAMLLGVVLARLTDRPQSNPAESTVGTSDSKSLPSDK